MNKPANVAEKIDIALYVVATPIGNLGDISQRALDTLAGVNVIAAEDTRNTRHLLSHFGINTRLIAVHEHNEGHAAAGIVNLLQGGSSVALVTDAGTPAVSDPGARVVAAVQAAGFKVVPIPGACALVAALCASGEGEHGFLFHGFLPARAGERVTALTALKTHPGALVFYESPHRIVEAVESIVSVFGSTRELVICRELTKRFESIVRLPLAEAVAWLNADENNRRGEFVLVLSPPRVDPDVSTEPAEDQALRQMLTTLLAELPLKQAVGLAVKLSGAKKNRVYQLALELQADQPE